MKFIFVVLVFDFFVWLVDNNGKVNQGRVEVFYNGFWGMVCDDKFDYNVVVVVCLKLGYERYFKFCRKIQKR